MKEILDKFDSFLFEKQLSFTGTIIGGAALNLMNVTSRITRDIHFIDPEIPPEIKLAAKTFLNQNMQYQLSSENWLNNGPISIVRDRPSGWVSNRSYN
jgi:hypothetical protein